ncbi:hypothetical protein Pfo_012904, partial [Paulownia fortunei]
MVLLDQLWDDVVAGPQPERGLKHLKKVYTKPLNIKVASTRGLCLCRLVLGRRRRLERRLLRRQRRREGIMCGGVCSTREATWLPRTSGLITLTSLGPTPLLSMT